MAHYAEIDENNIVLRVLVTPDDVDGNVFLSQDLGLGGTWIKTDVNSRGGIHYGKNNEPDEEPHFRFNYASINYIWDGIGFCEPAPFSSWVLDKKTYTWKAPIDYPTDGKSYFWEEGTKIWYPYSGNMQDN